MKELGKMRQGYFWPIYGKDDEIVFPFAPTREHRYVETFLGDFGGTLASDGEPEAADAALSLIGALYANEKTIRARKLKGGASAARRWRSGSSPGAGSGARGPTCCRGHARAVAVGRAGIG